MTEQDAQRLSDIIEFGERSLRLVGGRDVEAFSGDEAAAYAVRYCIQVIGEAAGSLSQEAKARYPQIPWQDIVAMRHKIAHHYQTISSAILHATVMGPLTELLDDLRRPTS